MDSPRRHLQMRANNLQVQVVGHPRELPWPTWPSMGAPLAMKRPTHGKTMSVIPMAPIMAITMKKMMMTRSALVPVSKKMERKIKIWGRMAPMMMMKMMGRDGFAWTYTALNMTLSEKWHAKCTTSRSGSTMRTMMALLEEVSTTKNLSKSGTYRGTIWASRPTFWPNLTLGRR